MWVGYAEMAMTNYDRDFWAGVCNLVVLAGLVIGALVIERRRNRRG